MTNRIRALIIGLYASIAIVPFSAAIALGHGDIAHKAQPPTTHQTPRTCFPRESWGANPALRPCAKIVRLYEDGSMKIRVSDANGTIRYSLGVGNPQG